MIQILYHDPQTPKAAAWLTCRTAFEVACEPRADVPDGPIPSEVHTFVWLDMRKLKHHEYRLLRKADFLQWKRESNLREVKVARRYHLRDTQEYHTYTKIVGQIKHLCTKLQELPTDDPVRLARTEDLLTKMYDLGFISMKTDLGACAKITVSAICRRRLPVVMMRLKFAENLSEATALIEQGHVRIGPTQAKDPAMLVTRNMEDFITWVDSSKIKRKISQYKDEIDDFDLLNA